ncbi:MAG: TetR/AcrR family transcriptional regulator [Deltaproteobacteria bacterium]|nr:TetR/AcrR family transcriptional regulator [Deltaproteobacteria bacterium]
MPKIVDKEQKRIEIARKAMPLVAKYGFANTPVRKITAEVGMGKGTFYDYFTNKEDILNEIIRITFADWTQMVISKIGKIDDPLEQLFIMLKEGSNLDKTFEQMMIIYVDLWRWSVGHKGADKFIPAFRTYLTNGKKAVSDIIEEAQQKGLIKKEVDSAALATALIALIDGMCMHYMILKPDFDVDAISRSFFESLSNGIKRT